MQHQVIADEVGSGVDLRGVESTSIFRTGGHRTHPNLKDTAVEFIRDQILSGEFPPGGKVDQDEIARTLAISRLPVREALIELAQEGYVVAIPRRGAFVVELAAEDITDHYRVFGMVAGLAARRCAERIAPAELAQLRKVHEELGAASTPFAQADLNNEFHRTINHVGGSRQLLSVLWFLSRGLPIGLFRYGAEWEATAGDHHATILRAIEAGDGDAAAKAVEQHFVEAGEFAVTRLRATGYFATNEG